MNDTELEEKLTDDINYYTDKSVSNIDKIKRLASDLYGVDLEEITNPWHAAISSFFAFSVGSLPPTLAIMLFPEPYLFL